MKTNSKEGKEFSTKYISSMYCPYCGRHGIDADTFQGETYGDYHCPNCREWFHLGEPVEEPNR